jgi:hypothetical protein
MRNLSGQVERALLGLLLLAGLAAGAAPGALAEADSLLALTPVGFFDLDLDGVNDGFCDADGDGINDVTGTPYRRNFPLRDQDGDGITDLFIDSDGDGENDIAARLSQGPDSLSVVRSIDGNGDGENDVLGHCRRTGKDFGRIDESSGREVGFVDEDGDGLNDLFDLRRMAPGTVRFVDRDGDGLHDGRALHHRHRGPGRGRGRNSGN